MIKLTGKVFVFKQHNSSKRKDLIVDDMVQRVFSMLIQPGSFETQMALPNFLVEEPSALIPVATQAVQFYDTPIEKVLDSIDRFFSVALACAEGTMANYNLNSSLYESKHAFIKSHTIMYGLIALSWFKVHLLKAEPELRA